MVLLCVPVTGVGCLGFVTFLGVDFKWALDKKRRDPLKKAKKMCKELAKDKSCAPILVRLAWHDSGTFDNTNAHKPWPEAGGAIGSILTDHEMNAGPNAGLKKAVTKYLQPIKDACPEVSWADLIQLASATAIEVAGGPKIPMIYGRKDGTPENPAPAPFGLPGAKPPFGQPGVKNAQDPAEHLRYVFYKYNMDDKDIVALSGAHTLGRAYKERSGAVEDGYQGGTAYTRSGCPFLANSETTGGRSWTKYWLKFDNSYYADMAKADSECIAFPTDKILMTDPGFKPHFDLFAKDQKAFFDAYALSHKKLSELGCEWRFKMSLPDDVAAYKADLKKAKKLCADLVKDISCAPILVRLAWHDSGTYDNANAQKPWPEAGGAIGSILTDHEMDAGPNAGLRKAVTKYLQPIKDQLQEISWADLIQLASATAIEVSGGPTIPMKYGRVDGIPTVKAPPPFGLPGAKPPFGQPGVKNPQDPAEHLRYVFYKYDMDDKDIVALSGAHTIGRAYKERSGAVEEGYQGGTAYTKAGCPYLANSESTGGRSWTKDWLQFNNSYFADMKKADKECIAFPTDKVLMTDPKFKPHFDLFASDEKAFFAAYQQSHKKLSELGCKFSPPEGITGI